MIKEICKNLYKIEVPLKGNPLRVLNSYFIKSPDKELVIDTGFQTEDCFNELSNALTELGSVPWHRDVLVTHLHADHCGNAHLIVGPGRTIYMSDLDRAFIVNDNETHYETLRRRKYVNDGFLQEWLDNNYKDNLAYRYDIGKQPEESFTRLRDGQSITVGDYTLKAVSVPGHTPGQMMLWDSDKGIMFTGDHVLFDITPNITNFTPHSLSDYLDNLKKVDSYDVKLALPGHRESGDYHKRIAEIIRHHDLRLAEAADIIRSNPGLNGVEICSRMHWQIRAKSWDDFPVVQKYFATGETLSHLDYLRNKGLIRREIKNDIWRYYIE